ncbi:MAG: M1 family aminopeptidase [Candidatus Kapaibacteriales bacterium]
MKIVNLKLTFRFLNSFILILAFSFPFAFPFENVYGTAYSIFISEKEFYHFGNNFSRCSHYYGNTNQKLNSITSFVKRPYDVVSYELYLDWYNPLCRSTSIDSIDKIWNGINKIIVVSKVESLNSIELDASELIIDSVLVLDRDKWQKILPNPKIQNNKLIITLLNPILRNDTATFKICYSYSRNIGYEQYRGFYLYPKGMYVGQLPAPFYDSVFVEEKLAYTMSEPEDARFWMPCNDAPYDKANAKISVRVPTGYVVASNGYLENKTTDGDSAIIYHWNSDKPITTYLMSVTASKYKVYFDWYKKVTNPNDSIQVQYYVWEKDYNSTKTDGSQYNSRNTFQSTVSMMEFFSKIFIEYPFIKYGMAVLMPFNFGGMEHQTMTSVNRAWLRLNTQFGIAHELAHQWIGDLVTCSTWDDIWFNEGGATWSEALYAEHLWGESGYNMFKLSARANYLKKGGLNLPAIYALPINTIFSNYAVLVYQKASWIYHMLQKTLGDSLFFKTFRSFLKDYSFQSIETNDLIAYFKNHIPTPPIDFDTFFDQWLFHPGHPVFTLNAEINTYPNDSNYHNAKITLLQIQSGNNLPDVFKTPVRVIFKNAEKEFSTILLDTLRLQQFSIALPFFPDTIAIDTTYILCEVSDIFLSIKNENNMDKDRIYPNPAISSSIVTIEIVSSSTDFGEVVIFDLLGNRVQKIFEGQIQAGVNTFTFKANELVSGTYQIRYNGKLISKTLLLNIF